MIDLKNLESRQLETRDLGDSLQFVLKPNPQWGNLAIGLTAIAAFAFIAWWRHIVILIVFAVVGLIGLVSNRLRARETTLRVSRAQVVATGIENSPTRELTIPLDEITSMGWNAGGQDDSGGLFVANGWTRSYVVPGATEAQAREMIATITGRFPGFLIDDKTWASLIWGDESVLIDEDNQGDGPRPGNSQS